MALKRDQRPAEARRHDVLLDRGLEGVIVRAHDPAWICRRFDEFRRHWIAGNPQLHRFIVNGESTAENFGVGIGRIAVSADALEQRWTARLVISMQHMARSRIGCIRDDGAQ